MSACSTLCCNSLASTVWVAQFFSIAVCRKGVVHTALFRVTAADGAKCQDKFASRSSSDYSNLHGATVERRKSSEYLGDCAVGGSGEADWANPLLAEVSANPFRSKD